MMIMSEEFRLILRCIILPTAYCDAGIRHSAISYSDMGHSAFLHASFGGIHIVIIHIVIHIIIHIRIPASSKQNDTWQNMACNNVK